MSASINLESKLWRIVLTPPAPGRRGWRGTIENPLGDVYGDTVGPFPNAFEAAFGIMPLLLLAQKITQGDQ